MCWPLHGKQNKLGQDKVIETQADESLARAAEWC
jgi:hypothetical protein